MKRARIDPELFSHILKQGQCAPVWPVSVEGSVACSDHEFQRSLHFREVSFVGDLKADCTSFRSLTFTNCEFRGRLILKNSTIRGDLKLSGCRFLPFAGAAKEPRIELDGTHVRGNLLFDGLDAGGNITLPNSKIEGDASFLLVDLAHGRGELRIDNCVVSGSLRVAPPTPAFLGQPSPSPARLALLSARGTACQNLEIRDIAASGEIDLDGMQIGGDAVVEACIVRDLIKSPKAGALWIHRARIAGKLAIRKCRVDELVLATAQITGLLELHGSIVRRKTVLRFASLQSGARIIKCILGGTVDCFVMSCPAIFRLTQVKACHLVSRSGGDAPVKFILDLATIAGQFDYESGEIAGALQMHGASFGSFLLGSDALLTCRAIRAIDCEFRSSVRFVDLTVTGGVQIDNCRFRSHLTFTGREGADGALSKEPATKLGIWESNVRVRIHANLEIAECEVDSYLDLSRTVVGPPLGPNEVTLAAGVPGSGQVRLDGTTVEGSLFIASPVSTSKQFGRTVEERANARRYYRADPKQSAEGRAVFQSLLLRDFSARFVDLTGLSIRPAPQDGDEQLDGHIVADRLQVTSALLAYEAAADSPRATGRGNPSEATNDPAYAYVEIEGSLRLRSARLGALVLSAYSFARSRGNAWQRGVVLELAEVGHLRVPQQEQLRLPAHEGQDACNGFPVPLDLTGLKVSHWSFDDKSDAEPSVDPNKYLDFLDNDERIHRDVYRSVARTLSDSGNHDAAERILFAEEYRAYWENKQTYDEDGKPEQRLWKPGTGRYKEWLGFIRTSHVKEPPAKPLHAWWNLAAWIGRAVAWADRALLRYRRNPIVLFYVILLLFLVSYLCVAKYAQNFELADDSRLIVATAGPEGAMARGIDHEATDTIVMARAEKWGFDDSLWMSIRYHIPIIPLGAHEEYAASNDAALRIGLPLLDGEEIWFLTGEDWFMLMSLVNWVLWPILLTFLLRMALRSD